MQHRRVDLPEPDRGLIVEDLLEQAEDLLSTPGHDPAEVADLLAAAKEEGAGRGQA